jgi:hypothetical protein
MLGRFTRRHVQEIKGQFERTMDHFTDIPCMHTGSRIHRAVDGPQIDSPEIRHRNVTCEDHVGPAAVLFHDAWPFMGTLYHDRFVLFGSDDGLAESLGGELRHAECSLSHHYRHRGSAHFFRSSQGERLKMVIKIGVTLRLTQPGHPVTVLASRAPAH